MKWMNTVSSFLANWSDRKTLSSAFWTWEVPPEVQFALCNKIGADCWFNMPLLSTDDYVTQFATLAHSMFNSNLKAYVEYGNEIWLNGASILHVDSSCSLGSGAFPTSGNNFAYGFNYACFAQSRMARHGRMSGVRMRDGLCVLRAGKMDMARATNIFWVLRQAAAGGDPFEIFRNRAQNVDVLATAPYFGYPVPNTFTLDQLFADIICGGVAPNGYPGGMIKQASTMLRAIILWPGSRAATGCLRGADISRLQSFGLGLAESLCDGESRSTHGGGLH